MTTETFYWFDFEGFGANPRTDRPCQFAGIRTDMEMNIIGDPLVVYAKPAPDYLPHPEAVLITGITPQIAASQPNSLPETEFFQKIFKELNTPGTIGVGYNSVGYDDEMLRHGLFRNFGRPYDREWGDTSRWDLYNLVKLVRTLDPEAIQYLPREDGSASLRLEDLATVNNITQEQAHDALSDVYATIGLARLIKDRSPILFSEVLRLRTKTAASKLINTAIHQKQPLLLISGLGNQSRGFIDPIHPVAHDGQNKNGFIVYDFSQDPTPLFDLSADEIHEIQFSTNEELATKNIQRLPLQRIAVNKLPAIIDTQFMPNDIAAKINIYWNTINKNIQHFYDLLRKNPSFIKKIQSVYTYKDNGQPQEIDVDLSLYAGGFPSQAMENAIKGVWSVPPHQLKSYLLDTLKPAAQTPADQRYISLMMRYRARNYPETLSSEEKHRWHKFCINRISMPTTPAGHGADNYTNTINALKEKTNNPSHQALLQDLKQWLEKLTTEYQ